MAKRKKLKDGEPGWFVREWLEFKGLKQKDLVSRTDWNKSQISEWMNGRERWNRDVLYGLAYAIGVEAADLLRPPPSPENPRNEIADYVMRLDEQKRRIAINFLKTLGEDDEIRPARVA